MPTQSMSGESGFTTGQFRAGLVFSAVSLGISLTSVLPFALSQTTMIDMMLVGLASFVALFLLSAFVIQLCFWKRSYISGLKHVLAIGMLASLGVLGIVVGGRLVAPIFLLIGALTLVGAVYKRRRPPASGAIG